MERGIFLLLGSNLGNREENLALARVQINSNAGKILKCSSLYKTAAWGNTNQQEFYNQAIKIQSDLLPDHLLEVILKTEAIIGRTRAEKWGPRIIDIDILFFDDMVINNLDLVIPHPEIAKRRFTLVPLVEIAPEFIHPVLKKNIKTLFVECNDPLWVEVINPTNSSSL